MSLDWLELGDYDTYSTAALYQSHNVCENCFELFRALEDLRSQELNLAWRLGIIEDRNEVVMIPESGEEKTIYDKPKRSFKIGMTSYNKKDTEEQNEWKLYYKNKISLNASINQTNELKTLNRYRFFVVLEDLREMSAEFYNANKITLVYSLIGFENRIVLTTEQLLNDVKFVPIHKVRLYYFFSNSNAAVNKLLKDKDVIFLLIYRKHELISISIMKKLLVQVQYFPLVISAPH